MGKAERWRQKNDFKGHWDDLVREHVVAVGWRGVKIDPTRSKSRINSAGGSAKEAMNRSKRTPCIAQATWQSARFSSMNRQLNVNSAFEAEGKPGWISLKLQVSGPRLGRPFAGVLEATERKFRLDSAGRNGVNYAYAEYG